MGSPFFFNKGRPEKDFSGKRLNVQEFGTITSFGNIKIRSRMLHSLDT